MEKNFVHMCVCICVCINIYLNKQITTHTCSYTKLYSYNVTLKVTDAISKFCVLLQHNIYSDFNKLKYN